MDQALTIKYYKKKTILTAVQWTGENLEELEKFTNYNFRVVDWDTRKAEVHDFLHDTWIKLEANDHIGRGPDGECYPIKNNTLKATYREIKRWLMWFRKWKNK